MRDILIKMFRGWILHENSWDHTLHDGRGGYARTEDECFVEACDGNVIEGSMILLFTHWSNDIESLAPHFGVELTRNVDGKLCIRKDVPPAPTPEHWWKDGEWVEPPAEPDETVAGPVPA